jgi:hypothetical protein
MSDQTGIPKTDQSRGLKLENVRWRDVKIPPGAKLLCRDVYGHIVEVQIRKLKDRHKTRLMETLHLIRDRLQQPNQLGLNELALCVAMGSAAFVGTRKKTIAAYTSSDPQLPFIILNELSRFWNSREELAVTLLHELLHMLETLGCLQLHTEFDSESREEAVHDLLCYALLDFGIPEDHWAFRKYPDLLLKTTQTGDE